MFVVYVNQDTPNEVVSEHEDIYEAAEYIAELVKEAVVNTWNVPQIDIYQEW